MKNLIILVLALIFTIPSIAQINVSQVNEGSSFSDKQGVFYALPSTLIQVKVEVLKTEYIAGPYAEYASKYLDLDDVNTSDYNEYEITDVKLTTKSIPDHEQIFFAEITDKVTKEEKSVLLSLSKQGMAMDLFGNHENVQR